MPDEVTASVAEPEDPPVPKAPRRRTYRHSRKRRRLPLWVAISWVVVLALAVVAGMRLFAWDRFDLFALLNTITAFIYLPAWIVAVVALISRRYVLGAAALAIVVVQVVLLLPELTAAEPLPGWTNGAPTIRLFDANVYDVNRSMAGYAAQIKADRPQLLTMEEATSPDVAQLKQAGALARLPYRFEVSRFDPKAFFIASAYRLSDPHVVSVGGRPLMVQLDMRLPTGEQTVWVVHTDAPLSSSLTLWQAQLTAVSSQIRRRGTERLLVVGDFNATWGNKGFRQILGTGMVDAAAARGKPFAMTWSQTEHPLPPFVRIDHVLTGPNVAVAEIATGPGPGSDHRDLQATVAIRR